MRAFFTLYIGCFFAFILTGCFGEDYDVGVPTAHLDFEIASVQLTEANISWNTPSEDVHKTIENIEDYASTLDEIRVFSGQKVSLNFKENKENGGDIWTDPKITVALLKDNKRIEIKLDDSGKFQFPTTQGQYVLEVEFINSAGSVQYLGNIDIVEKTNKETKRVDGKLPEFSSVEMPSIQKVSVTESSGVVFDHSYEEVCWNNCDDNNQYNYPDIHSGNVEISDKILIDWHEMKPYPTEINIIQIGKKNNNVVVIKKEYIDIANSFLEIEVDEEMIGSQYALEFLWKVDNEIIGRTILNFRLE